MISKKKAIIFGIVLVILSSTLTFTFTTAVYKEQYNQYLQISNRYGKLLLLEEFVKNNYLFEIDENALLEGQIKGMFEALGDPYSVYMTKDEFTEFMEHTRGTYSGIGIIVAPGKDNLITVVEPIEDSPGQRAGLITGDKIVKVNDKEFTADKMEDAVKEMKGKPGTKVKITILRIEENGEETVKDLTITRQEIRQKTVKSQLLNDKIGYIRIISFDEQTYKEFKSNLKSLEKQGMEGLIIDLRNNPGGLLDQCAEIADELIGEGIIVYTETKNGEREYLKSDKNKIDIPLVMLINDYSASASEILSGAVKDTKAGILVGTKTYGKGIVQRIKPLQDGTGFKLTVSSYYTPNGINIHGKGIEPDIVIELPENVYEIGLDNIDQDTQLQKAIEVIKEKMD